MGKVLWDTLYVLGLMSKLGVVTLVLVFSMLVVVIAVVLLVLIEWVMYVLEFLSSWLW